MIDENGLKNIENEDWKDATGITESAKKGTNAGLAARDWELDCRTPNKIGVFHGFHVWWCSTHHQPKMWCDRARAKARTLKVLQAIILAETGRRADPTEFARWMTTFEIDPTTLGQLTGLLDKNGKEIYGGGRLPSSCSR